MTKLKKIINIRIYYNTSRGYDSKPSSFRDWIRSLVMLLFLLALSNFYTVSFDY